MILEDNKEELKPVEYEIVSSGSREEVRYSSLRPISPWKVKLIFWSVVVGGIALGALFLFFFLTLFIYIVVPLALLIGLWYLVKAILGKLFYR